jgi:hypothetical protein
MYRESILSLGRAKPCGDLLSICSRTRLLRQKKEKDKKDEADDEESSKESSKNSGEREK